MDADTDAHVPQQEPATAENIGDTMKSIIDGIVDQAAAEAAGTKIVADAVAEIPQEQQNPPIELNLKDPRYGHVYRKDAFLVLRFHSASTFSIKAKQVHVQTFHEGSPGKGS